MKAILLHPHQNMAGNLLWSGELPSEFHKMLLASLELVRKRGYWASAFPEGDGITFSKNRYDPVSGLTDFRECFNFIDISEREREKPVSEQLSELAGDDVVTCHYLVPVVGLRLIEPIKIGATSFHPPVDGFEFRLQDHPWGEHLCDEIGADTNPEWAPGGNAVGTTTLLARPLIERRIPIPTSLLHAADANVKGQENLLELIIEDADHALDPLRYTLCHYQRLHYLPNKAGWIDDFAEAYLMPQGSAFKDRYLAAKPTVLRVSNNWLGLEIGPEASNGTTAALAQFVDGERFDEIGLQIKAALRAFGKAFYLVDLEAAFLHILYTIDALCGPGRLVGVRHRIWVCACASGGNASRFQDLLREYENSYVLRNSIVHQGKSFAELGQNGVDKTQFMQRMLGLTIDDLISSGVTTRQDFVEMVLSRLRLPEVQRVVAARGANEPRLPIDDDSVFMRVIRHQTTDYPPARMPLS